MKRWIPWIVAAVVVVLLATSVWRVLATRQAQQKALIEATTQRKQAPVQLTAEEVLTVRRQAMVMSVPVSGALRAVESAMVKARAAGELQGLVLREGDLVRAGQEIARIDATEPRARLRQAQQQADAAKAQVDINQRQFSNNQALVNQGFISTTALTTSQASLNAAQSTYQAALSAADVARKGLEDTVVRSPITGLVSQRLVQPGERVSVDTRIIEVVDLSRLELEALLSPADSLRVQVGQQAQLMLEGSTQPLAATLVRINPSAQASSRTVPVYLQVAQDRGTAALRQGLFLQGAIQTGTAEVLVVPLDAVRVDKPVPYLQLMHNGHVAHVPVKVGARSVEQGLTWVAVDGVAEGARVLTGSVGLLPEGAAVSANAAAGAPASAVAASPHGADSTAAPASIPSATGAIR